MALTTEQNATLQLLLERGQSYDDLVRLLGVDESEVRARARAALTELGGADPDRNVGLTDYLLGQADPIGRADAVRHLRDDPHDYELASTLAEQLRELYPNAELPRLPGEPRPAKRRRAQGGQPSERSPAGERLSFSQTQTRTIAIAGAAAVLLIAVVLAITGAFSGGDDENGSSTEAAATTTADTGDEQIQRVPLRAPGGGDATGEAVFGLATGDQPYVDFSIDGLDPAPQDKTYVIWLMLTDKQGYPLSPIAVTSQGTFNDRFPIPSAVLAVVARVRFVDVSIAPVSEIRKIVRDAIEETSLVVDKPGETVLRGTIPRASAAEGGAGAGGE